VKRRPGRPVLITDAERSQEDQLRTREIRYVTMMLIRAGCLVLGAILFTVRPPLLWLWLVLCAIGMITLPWIAVVLANDRLPKERHRWRRHRHDDPNARELPSAPPGQVIDVDRSGGHPGR
jgi:hypothetical protein